MITRGFTSRRQASNEAGRIPPGQHLVEGFPVLSASPTPHVAIEEWSFELKDGSMPLRKWTWSEFNELPQTKVTRDIHCVTTWSKLDTPWEGVLVDDILAAAKVGVRTPFLLAHSYDGYSTNIAAADLEGNKAMVALRYEGRPLERDHGGPARLLVPHLYFWKSAKWIKGLQFTQHDEPGFWETRGYHIRGNPWQEQRYSND